MKNPANRSAFMDELRKTLEDVLPAAYFSRSWLSRRHIKFNGQDFYIDYTEEDAPQLIDFEPYCSDKKVRIEFSVYDDRLYFYVNGEFRQTLSFDLYKNKTSYAAKVAIILATI